jgi:hypothetical protein
VVASGLLLRSPKISEFFEFFFNTIFSACPLLSVAGLVSLMAGSFASSTLLKNPLLLGAYFHPVLALYHAPRW